jgi:hypothetical protein
VAPAAPFVDVALPLVPPLLPLDVVLAAFDPEVSVDVEASVEFEAPVAVVASESSASQATWKLSVPAARTASLWVKREEDGFMA